MTDSFDVFVDQFVASITQYGVALVFQRTPPRPPTPGTTPVSETVGTVRMSIEHLKVMAFLLKKQVDAYEREMGLVSISPRTLNQLQVALEDWDKFWARGDR